MTETEWADLINNTKEKLKKKTREALDFALACQTNSTFEVVLLDNGNYCITKDHNNLPYEAEYLEIFCFETYSEDLKDYDESFDFLFDNIWFQDIMFFLG